MIENAAASVTRTCPACELNRGVCIGEKNSFGILSCRYCGTLYTSRLPEHLGREDYDSYYNESNLTVPEFISRRLDEIVAGFSSYRQNNLLLDLGFGAGSFLQAATRAGWNVRGVELSKTAAEHARKQGMEVFCGELAKACYAEGLFDVVVASELLEHLDDAKSLLREIARVLRPGGLLWATTPHGKGASARLLGVKWSVASPPEHLQMFSLVGMKSMIIGSGFSKVRILSHGLNPFEILHSLKNDRSVSSHDSQSETKGFDRVDSSYRLNAFLSDRASRRILKKMINHVLSVTRLGDSLKIEAEK
jgi:SAM-dependent methyltransferase